jgi:uncharacterized membrane protein HdeD (DUF308 family)
MDRSFTHDFVIPTEAQRSGGTCMATPKCRKIGLKPSTISTLCRPASECLDEQKQPTATSQAAAIAGWSIWIAVLVILAALLAIILPVVAGIAVTLIIGWVLLMVGVLHLVYAFGGRSTRTRLWELLLGSVYILAGGYILFHPLLGLTTLTLLLAVYLLVKGVLELIQYFQTHPRRGLTWLILDGIINIVLALIIWSQWPFRSLWVIGTLIGISILFSGLSRLMLSMEVRGSLSAPSAL